MPCIILPENYNKYHYRHLLRHVEKNIEKQYM